MTQGPLLSCAGGRYRFEFFRIKEWNLSSHILTKWKITQEHPDFERKEWLLPLSLLSLLRKGTYGHAPSAEKCTGWGAGMENSILLWTQETPSSPYSQNYLLANSS